MLRALLGDGIELTIDASVDLGWVHVDPTQFEQVILNLALNARDAMGWHGRVAVSLSNASVGDDLAQRHPPCRPGEYVVVSVTDTGTGIAPEVQERMFEPFFTTKVPGQGTGLGLATVDGIVSQTGGFIEVRSELGQGARFDVFLPRAQRPEASLVRDENVLPPEELRGTELVLIVEDDASVREALARMLRRHGYRIIDAPDAAAALAQSDRHAVDVLLTDVVMPAMNGAELAARILARRPVVEVIYMSGHGFPAGQRLVADGATVVSKPIDPRTLLHTLRDVLAKRRAGVTSGSPVG